jgi:hypothetical protein
MPKPIICLAAVLSEFAGVFQPCFSNRQYKYFVTVLLALVECQERRTLSALLRCVSPDLTLSGLSRFFNKWRWSPEALAEIWLNRFKVRVRPLVQAELQAQTDNLPPADPLLKLNEAEVARLKRRLRLKPL